VTSVVRTALDVSGVAVPVDLLVLRERPEKALADYVLDTKQAGIGLVALIDRALGDLVVDSAAVVVQLDLQSKHDTQRVSCTTSKRGALTSGTCRSGWPL